MMQLKIGKKYNVELDTDSSSRETPCTYLCCGINPPTGPTDWVTPLYWLVDQDPDNDAPDQFIWVRPQLAPDRITTLWEGVPMGERDFNGWAKIKEVAD